MDYTTIARARPGFTRLQMACAPRVRPSPSTGCMRASVLIVFDDLTKQAEAYRDLAAAAPPAGPRGPTRRRVLPALTAPGALRKALRRAWRRFRPTDHRDQGQRHLGLHSHQRHLDHRRPGASWRPTCSTRACGRAANVGCPVSPGWAAQNPRGDEGGGWPAAPGPVSAIPRAGVLRGVRLRPRRGLSSAVAVLGWLNCQAPVQPGLPVRGAGGRDLPGHQGPSGLGSGRRRLPLRGGVPRAPAGGDSGILSDIKTTQKLSEETEEALKAVLSFKHGFATTPMAASDPLRTSLRSTRPTSRGRPSRFVSPHRRKKWWQQHFANFAGASAGLRRSRRSPRPRKIATSRIAKAQARVEEVHARSVRSPTC